MHAMQAKRWQRLTLPALFLSAGVHALGLVTLHQQMHHSSAASGAHPTTVSLTLLEPKAAAPAPGPAVVPRPQAPPPTPAPTQTPAATAPITAQPVALTYTLTSHSVAFSGWRARAASAPDSASGRAPATSDLLKQGLARSAQLVLEAWSDAGIRDGACTLQLDADRQQPTPRLECNSAESEAALRAVPRPTLASLVTWLRTNDLRQIELTLQDGRGLSAVTY